MALADQKVEQACVAIDRRDEPGNLAKAIGIFEEHLPGSGALAHCYMLAGRWDEAFDIYQREVLSGRYPHTEKALEGLDKEAFLAAHGDLSEVDDVEAGSLVRDALEACRTHFGDRTIDVKVKCAEGLPLVRGSRVNLLRVVLIILENAFEAILDRPSAASDGSCDSLWYGPWDEVSKRIRPVIRVGLVRQARKGGLLFTCRDFGIGLPRPWLSSAEETEHWIERRKHLFSGDVDRTRLFVRGCLPMSEAELDVWLFKPGWTSKGKGYQRPRGFLQNGPGMGLYMARQILRKHGGTIAVEWAAEIGTTVNVRLPAHTANHVDNNGFQRTR